MKAMSALEALILGDLRRVGRASGEPHHECVGGARPRPRPTRLVRQGEFGESLSEIGRVRSCGPWLDLRRIGPQSRTRQNDPFWPGRTTTKGLWLPRPRFQSQESVIREFRRSMATSGGSGEIFRPRICTRPSPALPVAQLEPISPPRRPSLTLPPTRGYIEVKTVRLRDRESPHLDPRTLALPDRWPRLEIGPSWCVPPRRSLAPRHLVPRRAGGPEPRPGATDRLGPGPADRLARRGRRRPTSVPSPPRTQGRGRTLRPARPPVCPVRARQPTFELVAKAVSPSVVHLVAHKVGRRDDDPRPASTRRPARA